jgi:hypothetical protein
MRNRIVAVAAAVALGACCARDASAALTFNFSRTPTTTVADYNTILPKFQEAAARWSSIYSDDITINLRVGYLTLDPGVIGSTSVSATNTNLSTFRTQLTLDAKTSSDAIAVANLPAGNSFSVLTRNQPNTTVLETPATPSQRNGTLTVPTAEAKAIGLLSPTSPGIDAAVTFSKAYAFDYDSSDGIDPGLVDFVGVATHEIGHAMGFSSGVDTIDRFTGNGPSAGTPTDLSAMTIYNPLDLFRHSTTAGVGIVDGVPGDDSYFSLDAGATLLAPFSRGFYNGNNAQASHWLDNLGVGIMDPTAGKGELLTITDNDRLAFDAIGYDLVPEPTTLALLLAPAALLTRPRRRRRAAGEPRV